MKRAAGAGLRRWLVAALALNVVALTARSTLPPETPPGSTTETVGIAGQWLPHGGGHSSIAPSRQLRLAPFRQVAASSLPPVAPRAGRHLPQSGWRPELIDWGGGSFLLRTTSPVRAPPA